MTAQSAADQSRYAFADLDRLSIDELTALRNAVDTKLREKQNAARDEILLETRSKLAQLGLSLDEILRKPKTLSHKSSPAAIKYRGPNGEEWSGRGRPPKWISDLEKHGRSREQFLIAK